MGIDYRHFVTPRAETWCPPTGVVFDIDASLRRMGLVRGEATVHELVLGKRPKEYGKLSPRADLPGEILVEWDATEEDLATASNLFGNEGEEIGLSISFECGPSYKVEPALEGTAFDGNEWKLTEKDRARAREAIGFRCQYLFDASAPPPRLRAPAQVRSPYDGSMVAPDPTRSHGVYCARLLFDFARTHPNFASGAPFPVLPSHVKAELEQAFAVPLREASLWS